MVQNIFLTSDLHFGHQNVIPYCNRPFTDVEHMNAMMVENWNKTVTSEDLVYILGDFSMNFENASKCAPALNGRKILIMGNHDRCFPNRSKSPEKKKEWIQRYIDLGFVGVHLHLEVELNGVGFVMAHLPYEDPEDIHRDPPHEYRYPQYRPIENGLPQLCGHRHQHWLTKNTNRGTLMLNVGIDAPNAPWSGKYRPASLEEVMSVYNEAKGLK